MPRRPARPRTSLSHVAPARAPRPARPRTSIDDGLKALFATLRDGVLLLYADGTVALQNAAAERLAAEGTSPLLEELPLERALAGAALRDVLLARNLRAGDEQLLATTAVPLPGGGVMLLLRDVTATAHLTAHIAVAEQQQRVLSLASARLDGSLDLGEVLQASVELATELLGFTIAWLALPNESDDTLDIVAAHDAVGIASFNPPLAPLERVLIANTLTGRCFEQGRTLSFDAPQIAAFYQTHPDRQVQERVLRYGILTMLLLPLFVRGRTIGVLGVFTNRSQHYVSTDDIARAETLANRVAVAVDHARLHGEARSLQSFYRSITNSAGALLLTLDRQLRMTWANGEWDRMVRWLNMPELLWHNVQGTSVVPLLPAARLPELLDASRRLLHEGALSTGQSTYQTELDVTLGGLSLTLLVNMRPRDSHQRTVEGLTVAVTDVSHLKRLEAALRERHDELQRTHVQLVASARLAATGELIAGVAHELNNPLTSVLGWTDLMIDEGAADLDAVRRIHESALRARRIVHGLLTFARQVPNERAWTRISELAETVLALKVADFRRNAIHLHLNVAPQLPLVWADGGQIQQVLLNLLSNAEQAMHPRGGEIFVTIAQEGDAIALSVADTGPGIPPAALERIFEPFFTTKPPGEGTGLGLAISHGIARAHGGSLHVENRLQGVENRPHGARFTLRLPLGRAEELKANASQVGNDAEKLDADERGRARTKHADFG